MNTILSKYHIDSEINRGTFGKIYSARNKITKDVVAIKIEEQENSLIKNEARIYQYLGKIKGIANLRMFLSDDKYQYLIIDLLGESLKSYKERNPNITVEKIFNICKQLTNILESIHNKGIVHRDIKPQNIVFDHEYKNIFLIDFGFSKKICDPGKSKENFYHIKEKTISKIIGTPNYISVNVHRLIEPSKRDDLESMIYVLLFLMLDKLPWHNKDIEEICQIKEYMIYSSYNIRLINILKYIRELKLEQQPNYNNIVNLL